MDIELDTKNGIQTAKEINQIYPNCQIIYITNYIDYISDVYETSHVYYVLKQQIDRYLPSALLKASRTLETLKSPVLIVPTGREKIKLLQNDIIYMERILRKTEIHTASQPSVVVTGDSLYELKETLCPWFFFSHRSYLVNLRHITNINRKYLTLSNHSQIPVSRSHYEDVKKGFARYAFNL